MDYNNYAKKMWPYDQYSPMMHQPTEALEQMYPDIYNVVYPRVKYMCSVWDVPGNQSMYPYPSREAVERMTEEIYKSTCEEIGYYENQEGHMYYGDSARQFGYGGYGRPRRFLRNLTGILLIRELLGRRGRFYY